INTPVITSQPSAQTVTAGSSTNFTVATSAPGATHQWQYATAVGGPYSNVADASPAGVTYSGNTTETLTVNVSGSAAPSTARYYRAVVTSGGCSANSNGAQLSIVVYCLPTYTNGTGSGDFISL